jgi:hypothetical protein
MGTVFIAPTIFWISGSFPPASANRERIERRRSFGVDDALAVKLRVLFEQLPVLNQQRTALSGGERVLVVAHAYAGGAR